MRSNDLATQAVYENPEEASVAKAIGAVILGSATLAYTNYVAAFTITNLICSWSTFPFVIVAILSMTAFGAWLGYKIVGLIEDRESEQDTVVALISSSEREVFFTDMLDELGAISINRTTQEAEVVYTYPKEAA